MFEVGLAHAHPDEPEHVDPGGGGGAAEEQSDRERGEWAVRPGRGGKAGASATGV